jgi:hypothetical protein
MSKLNEVLQEIMKCIPGWHGVIYRIQLIGGCCDGLEIVQATTPFIGQREEILEDDIGTLIWVWSYRGRVNNGTYLFEYLGHESRATAC